MKLKQIISAVLITTLFPLGMTAAVLGAENSADEAPDLIVTEAKVTKNGGLVNFDNGTDDNGLLETSSYPKLRSTANTSYNSDVSNLQYVTAPKDQSSLGTCWAFSAASCVETLLMMQDSSTDASNSKYDLSELHAVLASSNKFLQEGTYGYVNSGYDGGNQEAYAMYTTRAEDTNLFNGPVEEKKMSYTVDTSEIDAIDADDMNIDKTGGYFPGSCSELTFKGELTAAQIKSRNTIIKKLIDNCGSVSISIYSGASSTVSYENFKNTSSYTLFYQVSEATANHAVTIVGYDDSFDGDIFETAGFSNPGMDGAFIVKNSWGTDWGLNGGYFYMSYASYISSIYAFGDLVSRDSYDYEYDYTPYASAGGIMIAQDSSGNYCGVYANYFEKQSAGRERINKISVYVESAETTLNLYVDTDYSDGINNNMQLLAVKASANGAYTVSDSGTSIEVPYAGNYVFELVEPVEAEGDFTVAVYGASPNGAPVAFESGMNYTDGSTYIIHKFMHKSYLSTSVSRTFFNVYDTYGYEYDFMIRAYTEEVPVNVTIDEKIYEADYGAVLSDVLSNNNISETVYEAVSGESSSYRPADTSVTLTEDITLYTGSYISAPTVKINNYQAVESEGIIRFVGEITDNFETDLSGVDEITALGFVYSTDGGDTTIKIECMDLYEELKSYSSPGSDVYLFKSEELEAGSYTVSAYISYSLTDSDDIITVYTAEKTISVS